MKRILVIEDDPVLNQNINDALSAEGYEVLKAFDGDIAERLLKKQDFDCVVLDINLPHKNGFELCKSFRSYNSQIPVIMLTAFDELEDKVQGYESGADDYLTKPFYMKELILKMNALTKRKGDLQSGNEPELLIFEDIVIDDRNKIVKRSNTPISLTPREYQVLRTLVNARGELVSKQHLVKEIWGSSFDANTNTIEVYINFLRNKIDKPFEKQLIKTKVGYGYYLGSEA